MLNIQRRSVLDGYKLNTNHITNPVAALVKKLPGWHFIDHIAPVWLALPPERRGPFFVHPDLRDHAEKRGIPADPYHGYIDYEGPYMVANHGNMKEVLKSEMPCIHIEHGCGLTYTGGNDSPSMFPLHKLGRFANVIIVPGSNLADRYRRAYPQSQVFAVGSPKMDKWCNRTVTVPTDYTVCFSTHFNRSKRPEATSTFSHYLPVLPELAQHFKGRIIGHAHPHIWDEVKPVYEEHGIEPVQDFEEVLSRAHVYLTDSSSTLYEAALAGLRVVALNAPWYRRDVHHGLRFWDHIPGLQCDNPEDLIDCIELAAEDPPSLRHAREDALDHVYEYRDGYSGLRAATAIQEVQSLCRAK